MTTSACCARHLAPDAQPPWGTTPPLRGLCEFVTVRNNIRGTGCSQDPGAMHRPRKRETASPSLIAGRGPNARRQPRIRTSRQARLLFRCRLPTGAGSAGGRAGVGGRQHRLAPRGPAAQRPDGIDGAGLLGVCLRHGRRVLSNWLRGGNARVRCAARCAQKHNRRTRRRPIPHTHSKGGVGARPGEDRAP